MCLVHCDAIFQPPDDVIVVPFILTGRVSAQGKKHVLRSQEFKIGRHDTNHCMSEVVNCDGPSDHAGICPEATPPQSVAENRDGLTCGTVLFGGKSTSAGWLHTQNAKEVSRYQDGTDVI